jgi:hypothetical protein
VNNLAINVCVCLENDIYCIDLCFSLAVYYSMMLNDMKCIFQLCNIHMYIHIVREYDIHNTYLFNPRMHHILLKYINYYYSMNKRIFYVLILRTPNNYIFICLIIQIH